MAEPGHYDGAYWKPHPASHLAFLITSMELLDQEPEYPLWRPPLTVPANASQLEAQRIERANRNLLVPIDAILRKEAAQKLAATGADATNPAAEEVLELLVSQRRLSWEGERPCPGKPIKWKRASIAIAATARLLARSRQYRSQSALLLAVQDRLNLGKRGWDKNGSIADWNVRGAIKRYDRDCLKFANWLLRFSGNRDVAGETTVCITEKLHPTLVEALGLIEREAATRSEYRGKSGEELARAIDRTRGMAACVDKALNVVLPASTS